MKTDFNEAAYELGQRRQMDAYEREQDEASRLADLEYMQRQEVIAIADLYAAPACNAIRAIPLNRWSKEVVRQIITSITSKVIQSTWSETEDGDEIICTLTDLDANLGARQ